jgi:hypothetical protein
MSWVITTCGARCEPAHPRSQLPTGVRELMIAHAQPGLHQVYEQYSYLEENRSETWSAHLRRILCPPTGRQRGRVAQVDSSIFSMSEDAR